MKLITRCEKLHQLLRFQSRASSMCLKKTEKKVPKSMKKVWRKVGRPAVLNDRDKRRLERAVKKLRSTNPNFSVMDIVQASGIDTNRASYRTFVRYVKKLGYAFYNSRKKGVMTDRLPKKTNVCAIKFEERD